VVASPLGIRTNNVAEYAGLVLALRVAVHLQAQEVELLLDSKLIVEQLNGRWRLRDPKLRGLYDEARRTLAGFRRWSAVHEPRLRNRAADALANLALDDPEAAARRVAEVAATSGCPHYQAVLASTHGDPRPVDRALRAARAAGATPASTTTAPREIV
jgi:probable phosphoglycerate mutase